MNNPTNEMLDARAYYEKNRDRAKKCASYLQDELSKAVYLRMIDFRCNSNPDRFPVSDKKSQYFYNEFFQYGNEEVFVDCGAYIGDTITGFKAAMKQCGGGIKRIIAFEPDERNYRILKKKHRDAVAIRAGAWSKDGELRFDTGHNLGTRMAQDVSLHNSRGVGVSTYSSVPVRAIDGCPEITGVTLLKMDIEGAEMDALMGAKNTITHNKPKLAICIYHSDDDMIRIIEWVRDNYPEYKLFVRQHNRFTTAETVLYGVV